MTQSRTSLSLLLILALVIPPNLIFVEPATAVVSKPSVPQFTVKFINTSYPLTTINPYTGQSETTLAVNNSFEVTIKNQPAVTNGQLYYNIRLKPSFDDEWKEVYAVENRTSKLNDDGSYSYGDYLNRDTPIQSTSTYTTIAYPVVETDLYEATGYDIQRYYSGYDGEEGETFAILYAVPAGGKVDVQVEALVGVDAQYWVIEHPFTPYVGAHFGYAVGLEEVSGWSSTQTVTIGSDIQETLETPAQTVPPTGVAYESTDSSMQVNDLVIIVVAASTVTIVAIIAVAAVLIKRAKTQSAT